MKNNLSQTLRFRSAFCILRSASSVLRPTSSVLRTTLYGLRFATRIIMPVVVIVGAYVSPTLYLPSQILPLPLQQFADSLEPKTAYAAEPADVFIFHTVASGSSFIVPLDWNPTSNSIEVIGAGGGGAGNTASGLHDGGAGGGGGGYSKITNLSLTPGNSIVVGVGTGGTGQATPTDGGHTWFNANSFVACTDNTVCVKAEGGEGGNTVNTAVIASSSGGDFGSTASAVGTTLRRGGDGGAGHTTGATAGGGGGGAAGKFGNGGNGANAATTAGWRGSGGGGNDNGTAGTAGTSATAGGTGGNGYLGASSAGGTGGNPGGNGTNGGGGGGGNGTASSGGAKDGGTGSMGAEWVTGVGTSGGGGGGGGNSRSSGSGNVGGTAGNNPGYGGGGGGGGGNADSGDGGGDGGDGGDGIIVIKYRPLAAQSHFKWFQDDSSIGLATAISAEDIKASGSEALVTNNTYRLRLQLANIKNYGSEAFTSHKFRLEMARAGTSCVNGGIASGWRWTTVPTTATLASHAFDIEPSSNFTDGASISSAVLSAPTGATTFTNGYALDTRATSGFQTIADNAYTEIEWAIKPNSNANTSASYCFRAGWITDASTTPDTLSSMSYSKIASASVQAQVINQSAYRWFENRDSSSSLDVYSEFGTDGVVSQTGTGANVAYTTVIDGEYMYVAGDDNDNQDWRIEKRNKKTGALCSSTNNCVDGAFDTDGIITQTGTSSNHVYSIVVDGYYLYVIGGDNGNGDWRIDKYNKTTGNICSSSANCPAGAFDTDGTLAVTGTNSNTAFAAAVDDFYLYIGGTNNDFDARIEKRNKTTGAICSSVGNCPAGAFDTDGIIAIAGTLTNDISAISIDDYYIYAAGVDNDNDWRIDKYNKFTGTICSSSVNCADGAFDTDGILDVTDGSAIKSIDIDKDYLYIAGYDSNIDWRIEKRNKDTGTICDGVSNCLAGAFDTDGIITQPTSGGGIPYAVQVDDSYLYVGGSDNSSGDWRLNKYNKNTGNICDSSSDCVNGTFDTDGTLTVAGTNANALRALAVDGGYLYLAGTDNSDSDWRMERRNKDTGAICDGSANCVDDVTFSTDGMITEIIAGSGDPFAIDSDDDYVYVGGSYTNHNYWLVIKYNKETGEICNSTINCPAGVFDTDGMVTRTGISGSSIKAIEVDGDYLYIAGEYESVWRIEKYNKNTGAICDSTPDCAEGAFDTDGILTRSGQNTPYGIFADDDYLYVAGIDDFNDNALIDKYNKITGAICDSTVNCPAGAFSGDGTIPITGTNANGIFSAAIDGEYFYVGGYDNDSDWRIDKYNKTTGNICSSTANCAEGAFDTDGIITQAGTGTNYVQGIAVNGSYLYVTGSDNSVADVRIDKYNKTTGAICSSSANCVDGAFDTDGTIAIAGTGNNHPEDITIDEYYLYITGTDNGNGDLRIDKYNKTTGNICDSSADCAAGAFDIDGIIAKAGGGTNGGNVIMVDDDYVYVAGDDNGDWSIDKYYKDDGALAVAPSAGLGADIGVPFATQDNAYTLTSTGQNFRLRLLLHAGTGAIASGSLFNLQYAGKGGGSCTSPSGTPSSYTDISGATFISFLNNPKLVDDMKLKASVSVDPTHGSHDITAQSYEELNTFGALYGTISSGSDGLWDFALYDNGGGVSTTYCFRATTSTGVVLGSYVYPEITTAAEPIPDVSRGGGGGGASQGGESGGGAPQGGGGQGDGGGEEGSGGGGGESGGGAGGGGGGSPVIFDWKWLISGLIKISQMALFGRIFGF